MESEPEACYLYRWDVFGAVAAIVIFGICWSLKGVKRLRPIGRSYEYQAIQRKNDCWTRGIFGKIEELGFQCPDTMYEIMERGLEVSGNGPCLGDRTDSKSPYKWMSYSEVLQQTKDFGAGLAYLGLQPETDSFVGIYAKTSKEWTISAYACFAYSLVVAPFYDALGPAAIHSAINRLNISVLLCGEDKNFRTIVDEKKELKFLKTVIFMEDASKESHDVAQKLGIRVYHFAEILDLGRSNPIPLRKAKPEDTAMLMFTSGTTGEPKAAVLKHSAVAATVRSLLLSLLPTRLRADSVGMSYLPLAHIMAQLQEMALFANGGSVGYNSSGIPNLADDIKVLRPDVLVLVPRVLNRLYAKMLEGVRGSRLKAAILNMAIFFKSLEMHFGFYRSNSIWDKLVFKRVTEALGGRVRVVATGSAPQDATTLTAMQAALGCFIFEVYGQTETCGIISGTLAGDPFRGHVGPPVDSMEIKLVDVPELGYYAKEGKGEICVRGKHLMTEYYKMPEKTAETIDVDGFLHTGDVGQFIQGGRLQIIDRKKHIFKLSQGEYVAPEKIEAELKTSPLFMQVFVDGSSLRNSTVALIHPDNAILPENLRVNWASGDSLSSSQAEGLEKYLLEELEKVGRSRGLKSYEIPKKVHILSEPFSAEKGFLTPTQKVKRETVRTVFRSQLNNLFSKMD